MRSRFAILLFIFTAFVGGGLTGAWWVAGGLEARAATGGSALPAKELQEMSEIYTLIRHNYVEEIPGGELIKRAVRGMVSSLDPHSSYLSDTEYNTFVGDLTNKEYGGVGIYIGTKDDWIEIIAPIFNTPAARGGLNSGDLILKIDGESTQGMAVEDAVEKMRGEVDTVLQLEILPDGGSAYNTELVRETIVTPSVLSALVGEGYGYLRVTRFQNMTREDLVNGINGVYQQHGAALKGIVLDMRNNPGGYLQSGVGVAAVFLPAGVTVVIEKGRDQQRAKQFTAQAHHYDGLEDGELLQDVPLVVLVNNGSASASEIVAGALQDHRRAVIVGTRTYGKASVQSLVQLRSSKGASALRLTTARYYTPLERNIQARGIEPDIVVNQLAVTEQEEEFVVREGDIAGHLENDDEAEIKNDETAADEEEDESRPPFINEDDYQYDQALQILKALAITAAR